MDGEKDGNIISTCFIFSMTPNLGLHFTTPTSLFVNRQQSNTYFGRSINFIEPMGLIQGGGVDPWGQHPPPPLFLSNGQPNFIKRGEMHRVLPPPFPNPVSVPVTLAIGKCDSSLPLSVVHTKFKMISFFRVNE